jgi:hypothetical protein
MQTSHLKALQDKHRRLEQNIHSERLHPACDNMLVDRLKKEKLHIKELIARYAGEERA